MSLLYKDIRASLFKFCAVFIDDMVGGLLETKIEPFDFDAHGETQKLPENDLIGVANMVISTEGPLATTVCVFGISTNGDLNLFRMTDLVAEMYERLLPGKQFPLVDAITGVELGKMTVADGTEASFVMRAEQRPLKFIGVTLKCSRAFS